MLHVVLLNPRIPWNAGNIGRTCVAVGAKLHLSGKLGFGLSDADLKRAGLDYWPLLRWERHENAEEFLKRIDAGNLFFFSTKGSRSLVEARFPPESYLVFGSETEGLPAYIHKNYKDRIYRVPMLDGVRSLNLSTTAGIAIYEAVRKLGLPVSAGR